VIIVQLLSVRIFQVAVWVPHRWSVLLSSSRHRACVENLRDSVPLLRVESIRAVPSEARRRLVRIRPFCCANRDVHFRTSALRESGLRTKRMIARIARARGLDEHYFGVRLRTEKYAVPDYIPLNMDTQQRYFFWAVQHPNQIAMGLRSRSKYDRSGYPL